MVDVRGGDKLAALLAAASRDAARATSVSVGVLEGATYPTTGTSVGLVAAVQEFGAPKVGVPPRPFFRPMIAKNAPEWPKAIAALLKMTGYDTAKTLDGMGDRIAEQLKQQIVDTTEPPLSPVTIMLRGMRRQSRYQNMPFGKLIAEARRRVAEGKTTYGASTKPLEDTLVLLHSISHEVK